MYLAHSQASAQSEQGIKEMSRKRREGLDWHPTTVNEVLITQENITDYLGSFIFFFYIVNGSKIYDRCCKMLPHFEISDM